MPQHGKVSDFQSPSLSVNINVLATLKATQVICLHRNDEQKNKKEDCSFADFHFLSPLIGMIINDGDPVAI